MTVTEESAHVELRFGPNGEIMDSETGEVLGYAPGHDPAGAGGEIGGTIAALSTKFEEGFVQWKPGNGRRPDLAYISHAIVTDRLNSICPGWSLHDVKEHTYVANGVLHLAGVTASMTIDGVTRTEMGGPARQEDFASEAKNAMSDVVKRLGMRFGVALYLWESLLDSQNEDDVNPDREMRRAPAQQQAQPAPTRQTQPAPMPNRPAQAAPTQSRMNQTIGNLERSRQQGEIGAATVPLRPDGANRGVDPATIPGVTRGPQPQHQRQVAYQEYFPNTTRMDEVRAYLGELGIVAQGQQNMNDCRVAVNQWIKGKFGVDNAVVGTGNWNEQYKRNDLRPMDIGNALAHYAAQLSPEGAAEAAQAQARDTTNDDGWGDEFDDIPF